MNLKKWVLNNNLIKLKNIIQIFYKKLMRSIMFQRLRI